MKLTHDERIQVKLWLEKSPKAEDTGKVLELNGKSYGRITQYFGGSDWKVRIAYELETNYPVLMSSPIPGGQDSKGSEKPTVLVPKLPLKKEAPAAKKNPGFSLEKANDMLNDFYGPLKAQMEEQLNKPLVWRVISAKTKTKTKNYNTYKVHDSWSWSYKPGPKGVSKKAVKGSKAVHGACNTLFVTVGQPIPGDYWKIVLSLKTVPKGHEWVKASNTNLYTLVKK